MSAISEESMNPADSELQAKVSDPEKRILARRIRIQRRLEASNRQKADATEEEKSHEADKSPIDIQIAKSEELLDKLLKDSQELVTNVRVASDARERNRLAKEFQLSSLRREHLMKEAQSGMEQYNAIMECWDAIGSSNDVLSLHEDAQKQKESCDKLVQDKDHVIEVLKQELVRAEDSYVNDLKKQAEEIAMCAQRIDMQVDTIRRAYKKELILLEMKIQKEHEDFVEEGNRKWLELYKEKNENVNEQIKERFERVYQQQREVLETHTGFSEKYRKIKIDLENDIQVLQQEVEQIKAICLLNSEKLDYNYQVLKKKDEESTILKSQQKRKITKLLDVLSKLKQSIEETEQKTKIESTRLTEEVVRLHNNIMEIEEKSELFANISNQKYNEIWKMNEDNVLNLIHKVIDADKFICKKQLCIEWSPPDFSLIQRKSGETVDSAKSLMDDQEAITSSFDLPINHKKELLKQVLKKLVDHSDFLIEDRLHSLLAPYTSQESTLVCIDSIFLALGVNKSADIDILLEHFIPYLYCPICDELDKRETSSILKDVSPEGILKDGDGTGDGRKSQSEKVTFDDEMFGDEDIEDLKERKDIFSWKLREDDDDAVRVLGDLNNTRKKSFSCCKSHPLQIKITYILRALRGFASHIHQLYSGDGQSTSVKTEQSSKTSNKMAKKEVEEYWLKFLQIFPEKKQKLWDGLHTGLQKYYIILQDRHKLIEETTRLRNQNNELRQLLHTYITSNEPKKDK